MDQALLKRIGTGIPWDDVQGLVNFGYGHLPAARYAFLNVTDAKAACAWLADLAGRVTNCRVNPREQALNLAFTASGLLHLGVSEQALGSFSDNFSQGMVTPHRSRALGDVGPNDPKLWQWGNQLEQIPDVLLMVFAPDASQADADARALLDEAKGCSAMEGLTLEGSIPPKDGGDQFGFMDGIGQPRIAGTPKSDGTANDGTIAVGEFLIGRPNQRGQTLPVPSLGLNVEVSGREFGRDGSYLVFRQMNQDPRAFHDFCVSQDPQEPARIASRLVGRWPDGTPLVKSPDKPDASYDLRNFGYGDDPYGERCPLGAHIRRANPRDGLRNQDDPPSEAGQKQSRDIVSHHRIMRRGRIYGEPWRPGEPYTEEPRGLHFICLQADLQSQFEQIQQTWLANSKFLGMYDEVDPLVGMSRNWDGTCPFSFPSAAGEFRQRFSDIPRFILVRGGAYFFLPGIHGLQLLSELA